jgi:hypothetical protein
MPRLVTRILPLVALLFVVGVPVAALPVGLPSRTADEGCVRGGAAQAAAVLVDEAATVVSTGAVAGLEMATAVDWRVTPGIPNALLEVDGRWCGVEAFNRAAAARLGTADPATLAAAFASVAAMPYLGEVVVRDAVAAGPVVTLETVGGRHGAVSRWTVAVDPSGVHAATFTTTGWSAAARISTVGTGLHADDEPGTIGDLEGITSLPGHTRVFTRDPDGRVRIDATVDDLLGRSARERAAAVARAATVAGLAPGDDLAHTFSDGLTIKVSYGLSPYTPDTGVDTGVAQADRLRAIHAGMIVRYNDFIGWGVDNPFGNAGRTLLGQDTGLPERAGYINVDSPLAPVCLACAYLTDAVEIHIALLFPELAEALVDVTYDDHVAFVNTVIGHEMVHSLQGGYANGSGGSAFTNAFIEGSARASETLHDDARHTYQSRSIQYVDNANGCEGFENGRGGWITAQANGPFVGHTYDACYFWWSYYATHGPEGLVALLEAMPEALATSEGNAAARNLRLLDVAAPDGGGAALDLARWGAAFTAGNDADGYTIPAGRTGEAFNWFALLRPAERAVDLGGVQEITLASAGVRAFRVTVPRTLTALPQGAEAFVFDVADRALVPSPAPLGTVLAPGQILVLVAPGTTGVEGYLVTG